MVFFLVQTLAQGGGERARPMHRSCGCSRGKLLWFFTSGWCWRFIHPSAKPGGVNEGFGFEWSRSVNGSAVPAGCNPAGCAECSRAGFALKVRTHRRNGMKTPRDLQGSGKIRARGLKCLNHPWGGDRSDDRQVKAACGRLRRARPRRQI